MKKREEGYYWIRRNSGSKWTVGKWVGSLQAWWLPLLSAMFLDGDFHEIKEEKLSPPPEEDYTPEENE